MEESKEIKKVDGRSGNGGHSTKGRAGRPPKVTEKKIRTLVLDSIRKEFGSEDKFWRDVAKQAKGGSIPHLNHLVTYTYGKPREYKEIDIKQSINIPVVNFLEEDKETIIDVTPNPESLNE